MVRRRRRLNSARAQVQEFRIFQVDMRKARVSCGVHGVLRTK
jgi:hypothetical protein